MFFDVEKRDDQLRSESISGHLIQRLSELLQYVCESYCSMVVVSLRQMMMDSASCQKQKLNSSRATYFL